MALSANGQTALIGAPHAGDRKGGAWVFTRSGSTWTRQGEELEGGEGKGKGHFGRSVALSADGDTALIGAPGDDGYTGAAWVFTRSGSTWGPHGEELSSGEEGAHFGRSVALTADGDTALIGAPGAGGYTGAAWVFTRSGSTWGPHGEELSSGEEGAHFGRSVALSADGDTALIGAPAAGGYTGAAWVFARSSSGWTPPEELTGVGEEGAGHFGYSVALSADGEHGADRQPPRQRPCRGLPGRSPARKRGWSSGRA